MDEPTTGSGSAEPEPGLGCSSGALKESGVTIIMSTHYMIEAETLCDRLAIMDHGNILDIGEPDEVVQASCRVLKSRCCMISETATREERAALRRQLEEEKTRLQRGGGRGYLVTAPRGHEA